MSDPILNAFLAAQHAESLALAGASDLLRLTPAQERAPDRYIAEFCCAGLVRGTGGEITERSLWAFGIRFPEDYLRRVPQSPEVVTYLGPESCPFHPNIRAPFVCVDIRAGMPLVEILYALWELLTWRLYSTCDEGLNHEASQWARRQEPGRFPIDPRPLKRESGSSGSSGEDVGIEVSEIREEGA